MRRLFMVALVSALTRIGSFIAMRSRAAGPSRRSARGRLRAWRKGTAQRQPSLGPRSPAAPSGTPTRASCTEKARHWPNQPRSESTTNIELALLGGALGFCGVGFGVAAATNGPVQLVAAVVAVILAVAVAILLWGLAEWVALRVKVALVLTALAVMLGAGGGSFAAIAAHQNASIIDSSLGSTQTERGAQQSLTQRQISRSPGLPEAEQRREPRQPVSAEGRPAAPETAPPLSLASSSLRPGGEAGNRGIDSISRPAARTPHSPSTATPQTDLVAAGKRTLDGSIGKPPAENLHV
jgi:hypothetical protein